MYRFCTSTTSSSPGTWLNVLQKLREHHLYLKLEKLASTYHHQGAPTFPRRLPISIADSSPTSAKSVHLTPHSSGIKSSLCPERLMPSTPSISSRKPFAYLLPWHTSTSPFHRRGTCIHGRVGEVLSQNHPPFMCLLLQETIPGGAKL